MKSIKRKSFIHIQNKPIQYVILNFKAWFCKCDPTFNEFIGDRSNYLWEK